MSSVSVVDLPESFELSEEVSVVGGECVVFV